MAVNPHNSCDGLIKSASATPYIFVSRIGWQDDRPSLKKEIKKNNQQFPYKRRKKPTAILAAQAVMMTMFLGNARALGQNTNNNISAAVAHCCLGVKRFKRILKGKKKFVLTHENQPSTPCMVFTFSYSLSVSEGSGHENAQPP